MDLIDYFLQRPANDSEKRAVYDFTNMVNTKELQYFDVKLITDRRQDFCKQVKVDIRNYRAWKASFLLERDAAERQLKAREGARILLTLLASLYAYRETHGQMVEMRNQYLRSVQRG
jgi:succinylglutamate desuccinylase